MTSSRIRRHVDMGRLRQALAGPGADPRSWVCMGIVDDDDDAIVWDDVNGWIVDVTITGGQLDGETLIPCAVSMPYAAGGFAQTCPVARNQGVVIIMPGGRLDAYPVIVGSLFSNTNAVPTEVNGDAIDEAKAKAALILVTDKDRDEQVAGFSRTVVEKQLTLASADKVALGDEGASQSFVKGDMQKDGISSFADSTQLFFTAFVTALASASPPIVIPVPAVQAFAQAVVQLKTDLSNSLSTKIKGE